MKYALLIYSSPELRDIPEDQLKSVIGETVRASIPCPQPLSRSRDLG